ncbi:hypothetical protein [Mycobacterium sp. AZCC_0083]|uniref:hypothetical protein n=1 Tax=Mycobacterium sp. AZCC_0083 TaxID=2735882 RepID=UPI00161B0497|nr:hypothetical protein [Mycobacterium sp. AZCC_0083]MBB5162487.1 hypothetical protein [Mycobacterium sp. AZCC_0083]
MTDFRNPTAAAPVDALLLAQARWRDDREAADIVARYSDPWAVNRELVDWLRVAVQKALECGAGPEFGDHDELDVIARWISGVPAQQGATP